MSKAATGRYFAEGNEPGLELVSLWFKTNFVGADDEE
jgi:hypothetical protein